MIGSKLKALVVLLAGIAGNTVAQAQTPAAWTAGHRFAGRAPSRWGNFDPEDRAQRPL